MEHSLHIASKHFVEAVAPASPTSIRKKVKAALAKARDNGELDLDEFNEALTSIGAGDPGNADDDNDNSDFTPGDSLGKALALVKQVHHPSCFTIPANTMIRFGCLPKPEFFSNHRAVRLGSNLSSCFSGFVPDGHHFTSFSIGC
jgi:hypothetical protein